MKLMYKSKMIKYMLVAIFALLPDLVWGLTEVSKYAIVGADGKVSVTMSEVLTSGVYSLWYFEDSEGNKAEMNNPNYWTGSLSSDSKILKVSNSFNSWDKISLQATDGNTKNYRLIVLSSSDANLYNATDESLAETKVSFTLIAKDEAPILSSYSGGNSVDIVSQVDDSKLDGGSISITDLFSTISNYGIWNLATNGGLSLADKSFYLRLSIQDKAGKAVDLSDFTVRRNGNVVSATELGNNYLWNIENCKNTKGIYAFRASYEYGYVYSNDLTFDVACASGKNINDYNVLVYVSDEQPTLSGNTIVAEPALKGLVKYTVLSQTQIDNLKLVAAEEPTGEAVKAINSIVTGTDLNIDLTSSENMAFVKKQLGLSETSAFDKLYVRWYIAKKDGTKIDGISSKNPFKSQQDVYWTWWSDDASASYAKALKASFTVPSDLDINDVDITCVISNDLPTVEYGYVTQEPGLKAKFTITLLDKYSMPFKHYVGHANTEFDAKGMQQTAEWEYYVYVNSDAVALNLPFDDFTTQKKGNVLEPKGYFRWYDYNKDLNNEHLKAYDSSTTKLHHMISDGSNYGLVAFDIKDNPYNGNVGVTYTPPTEATSADWAGEDIACDVSRYIDGLDDSKTYLLHEPTMSIRYIFHIRSAAALADEIMNTAIGENKDKPDDRTFEDGKKVTAGLKSGGNEGKFSLRLNLSDYTNYYFHPLKDEIYKHVGQYQGFTHQVYYADEANKLVESDFDKDKLCKATSIEWWAYDLTKTYCYLIGNQNSRFLTVGMSNFNGTWMPVSMTGDGKQMTFGYGDVAYIVAFAKDAENHLCPIANFDVRFMNTYPMTLEQITEKGLNYRTVSYLEDHYNLATKPISFDDDNDEQTLAAPTAENNVSRIPSRWDKRSYGFVYKDLVNYTATPANVRTNYEDPKLSPQHGEYGLYKTANIKGISGQGADGLNYLWHQSTELHDRTYYMSNGSQHGYFLYVDASDESRNIAAADFKADLCTGQQLIFSAAIADMTGASERPQVMFKLYGIDYDANGKVKNRHLVHSFSSGDFASNVESFKSGVWYQVYGKVILQQESGVERFSDFRLEIDNYCKNTEGADYAVDDIRMYIEPAKVQVLQDRPICGGSDIGNVKLKIRAIHETLNAILGHKDTNIYFRFIDEDGNPVTGDGLYDYTLKKVSTGETKTIKGNEYATVNVFDSEETCKDYEIDGGSMVETDEEGERYIVLGNHHFGLSINKKYYVAVSTQDPTKGASWGNPSDICSIYSDWFKLVSQTPYITDSDGNMVSDFRLPCGDADYSITVKGNLTTVDQMSGGSITLSGVKFDWYLDGKDEAHKISSTPSNEITLNKTQLSLGEHQLYMKPNTGDSDDEGFIKYTAPNGVTYLLCTEATPIKLRVAKDGPQLNFGFNDVDYPFKDGEYEASLRIGIPQLKALKDKGGYLQVPLHSAGYLTTSTDKTLSFIDDTQTTGNAKTSGNIYVATTNDPLWNATGATLLSVPVATLQNASIGEIVSGTQSTLGLKFADDVLKNFHEGYWYELRFVFEQRGENDGTTNCPGEAYLKVKIVPEFVTWRPTASGGMNANWNNDANWHRSSSAELYDDMYVDYQAYVSGESSKANGNMVEIPTIDNYVPMKFTKVTIDNLNGLPFPDLGNIVYRASNGIATKLTNVKGNEASKYIQYDIMAYWDESAANKGLGVDYTSASGGNGNASNFGNADLKCEKFYGNTCHQIYFKPQGELRDQCYLVYDKAWVEKELKPNTWYTMASPLQYIYAGDMYMPASNGRQETKAFTDIKFSDTADGTTSGKALYSRSLYPVYQRAWMKSDVKQVAADKEYDASHYPAGTATEKDVDVNLGYWSHIYNKVDESYAADGTFGGFSIKAGNSLLPKRPSDGSSLKNALLRLPKEDASYTYYDYDGNSSSNKSASVSKPSSAVNGSDGHGKLLVAYNNEEKHLAPMSQSLGSDDSGFYLVANPYTCSLSLKKFFEANMGLQKAVWIVEGSTVKSVSENDLADKDFVIQPTQAFFVRASSATSGGDSQEDGSAERITEVKFTSQMYVDRTITAGLQVASDYIKNVNISTQDAHGNQSMARIAVRQEASVDYDEQEDVDLLCDQNMKDIPQVYTVAGDVAVAVNAVPSIYWMPLGIVSDEEKMVTLSLQGISKLDAPLYLYDVATASYVELQEDEPVEVMAGEHGRYFLTQSRTTTDMKHVVTERGKSRMAKYYSVEAGRVVVTQVGDDKQDKKPAYTLEGKKVSVR